MKKIIVILFFNLLISCSSASINNTYINSPIELYKNPLIIIPCIQDTTIFKYSSTDSLNQYYILENVGDRFARRLKKKLELQFKSDNKKVKILVFDKKKSYQQIFQKGVNIDNEDFQKINNKIKEYSVDLLILLKPTSYSYEDEYQTLSIVYKIVAIDINTKEEIWIANFKFKNTFLGIYSAVNKSGTIIYLKLKSNKIL